MTFLPGVRSKFADSLFRPAIIFAARKGNRLISSKGFIPMSASSRNSDASAYKVDNFKEIVARNGSRNYYYIPNSEQNSLAFSEKALNVYTRVITGFTLIGIGLGIGKVIYSSDDEMNSVKNLVGYGIAGAIAGHIFGITSPISVPVITGYYIKKEICSLINVK